MLKEESVYAEVSKIVADRIAAGIPVPPAWMVTEFLSERSDIEGADAPLYRTCTRAHLERVVKRVIGKYDVDSDEKQPPLRGFEHLQRAYTVTRDTQVVLVPIDQCSNDELLDRAKQLDLLAIGNRKHARELRDFVRRRVEAA